MKLITIISKQMAKNGKDMEQICQERAVLQEQMQSGKSEQAQE
jgi:hypothetical protein